MMRPIPTVAARRRAPAWLWLLAIIAALAALIVASGAAWLASLDAVPIHIVIDGDEMLNFDLSVLSPADRVALAVAALVALVVVMLVVPLALLFGLAVALLGLVIGLVFGVGVPLAMALLLVALLTSPVWLLAAFGWWLWRRRVPRADPQPAKIAG